MPQMKATFLNTLQPSGFALQIGFNITAYGPRLSGRGFQQSDPASFKLPGDHTLAANDYRSLSTIVETL